ncbi:prephenate dehydrogenase [Rivihabitans pingtungensis]|uniref:prephenate dehydrogenase n=1 Tax=Rivihabitans pingtungensis TaxID=1054498 RepID=UPI002353E0A3|nr:prephenate dehydrogenase/arogenate dehydrogenase family protein [Rivihabitans pingtungensis]MCK6435944.1 prephenate dehydrogenase/arogenate dehydrogenase family protein [Rivihabitans pingtungensis]
MRSIGKLVIIGVGLIGGSFALAMKRAGLVGQVVGVGRSLDNLNRAIELGVIDAASQDPAQAVAGADLVMVATPVGQMGRVFDAIAPVLPREAIVTDAGSTKGDVAQLMRAHLPEHLAYCVPAHPIAGSDRSGAAAAQYGLFEQRRVVLTPLDATLPEAAEAVGQWWQASGARVFSMRADEHDAVFASVSHLPHLLAFAYVEMVANKTDAARCFDFAATGFKDFTRIAGSHPEMWRDISLANREALLADLRAYQAGLAQLTQWVEAGDGAALEQMFQHAREARVQWAQRFAQGV